MNGGVSHMESFDPKPELTRYAGKSISETPYADVAETPRSSSSPASRSSTTPMASSATSSTPPGRPPQVRRSRDRTQRLGPHMGSCVDDLAIVRSMWTTDDNHGAPEPVSLRPSHARRRVPRPSGPGSTTASARSTTTSRSSSPHGQPRILERQGRPLPRPAHDAVPIRVDPKNPLDYGKSAARPQHRRTAGRLRPVSEI